MRRLCACSSSAGPIALRLSSAVIDGRSRSPIGRESGVLPRAIVSTEPGTLLLPPCSRQRSPRIVGAPSTPSMAGTVTISLVPASVNPLPGQAGGGILRRILNEIETSLKESISQDGDDSDHTATARISDNVLATSLRADWEIERRWSGGLEVSTGLTQQQLQVVRPDRSRSGQTAKDNS
jgi:hypothetical protein